jgi:hypothetical protein
MILYWKDEEIKDIGTIPTVCDTVTQALKHEIEQSFSIFLDNPFIINDTAWFEYTEGKIKPRVTNCAEYISKKFQKGLEHFEWFSDYKLKNQEIDGYKEFIFPNITVHTISEANLRNLLLAMPFDENFKKAISLLYSCNFEKQKYLAPAGFDLQLFDQSQILTPIRVGLEFETGNIASSFRALSKLNFLFEENQIDLGIFITSDSKKVSTRIWPSSNRNGSLQELRQRMFLKDVRLPILICGFAPDGWDMKSSYLGNKERYQIETDREEILNLQNGQSIKMAYSSQKKLYKKL